MVSGVVLFREIVCWILFEGRGWGDALMSLILSGLLCRLYGADSLFVVMGIDCQFAGLSIQVRLPEVLSTKCFLT